MNTKKDIGSVLKTSLEGFSEMPSEAVWMSIEKKLIRGKRLKYLYFVLILLALLTTSLILIASNTNESENSSKKNEIENIIEPSNNKQDLDSKKEEKSDSINEKELNLGDQNNSGNTAIKKIKRKTIRRNKRKNKVLKNDAQHEVYSINLEPSEIEFAFKAPMNLNIQLNEIPIEDEIQEEDFEETWGLFPFASLDHYNAFGRKTSNQFSTNYGLFISYYVNEKISVRTGFKRLDLQYNFVESSIARQQRVYYSEIPIQVKYSFYENKLSSYLIAGTSFHLLEDGNLIFLETGSSQENTRIFKRQVFTLNAGVGLSYELNSNFKINLESVFNYQTSALRRNQDYSPFIFSTSLGLEYVFKL